MGVGRGAASGEGTVGRVGCKSGSIRGSTRPESHNSTIVFGLRDRTLSTCLRTTNPDSSST